MKHAAHLLHRVLLLIALVVASLPSGATETVCVLGKQAKVVALAKCGMPCCVKKTTESLAPEKRSCCAPKTKKASLASAAHKGDPCSLAGSSCRCETRLIAPSLSRVAAIDTKAPVSAEYPAVLPNVLVVAVAHALEVHQPGIVGHDSGPPPRRDRSPTQPRAPPVAF